MKLERLRYGMSVVAIALLQSACTDSSPAKQTRPLALSGLDDYRRCERDDQCVWVNNGCCDCANGGEDIAVRVDKKAAFRALFQCDNLPCTAIGSVPQCGTGEVACQSGLCVFRRQESDRVTGKP